MLRDHFHPINTSGVSDNVNAMAIDLVNYTDTRLDHYDFDVDKISKDFDIVAEPDEWKDVLFGDPDYFDGADNMAGVRIVVGIVIFHFQFPSGCSAVTLGS